jgi:hypothetical protein
MGLRGFRPQPHWKNQEALSPDEKLDWGESLAEPDDSL